MNASPVVAALASAPAMAQQYDAFREAAHAALGSDLTHKVRSAIADVHGLADAPVSDSEDAATALCLAYARRIPFEHTAITDEEAAAVVEAIGEKAYVALSVVAALADAECRVSAVDLPELVNA